ncbi:hypothetical protein T11_11370 [Trichinella zimbabwensis]|uniref:Uncharacterized protein n=1 Tax=Trichinella zimbabwensis TaxID=268475 RepID=A0A0V1H367_9BILA|nr:hypothetical protein T11_11370 [Trichinella zimbabwensis]
MSKEDGNAATLDSIYSTTSGHHRTKLCKTVFRHFSQNKQVYSQPRSVGGAFGGIELSKKSYAPPLDPLSISNEELLRRFHKAGNQSDHATGLSIAHEISKKPFSPEITAIDLYRSEIIPELQQTYPHRC